MATRIGERFGNYQLVHLLGQGGFAQVYIGKHIHLASLVAIKILHSQLVQHEQEEFLQEARLIASLDHPSIVRILDCGIERNTPFLIMNYAPYGTLRQHHPKGTQLPLTQVLVYMRQVASALQYAHELKVIHRDIKPENMLLGSQKEVLLSDFGIALISGTSNAQSTKAAAGTVAYMAPEQIMGKPRLASDQYALGVVIYEWLCGERPFRGSFAELCAQHLHASPPSMRAKNHQIAPEVEEVVMRSLAKEPQKRFAHVQDFLNALEQAAQPSLSSPYQDTSIGSGPVNDSTIVNAPIEDRTTIRTPIVGVTATRPQHNTTPFVNYSPEVPSQERSYESTAQNTPALSSGQDSQALSPLNTLLAPVPSQQTEKVDTTRQRTHSIGGSPELTTTARTRRRRRQRWLLITLVALIVFTLITGSLVFAQRTPYPFTNKRGISAQIPTTLEGASSKKLAVKISPTVLSKHTPTPDATAPVDLLPNATASVAPLPDATAGPHPPIIPRPNPTSVPPTLTASPSSFLVTNSSSDCTVDTHGGGATGMTCNVVLSNTSQTSSTLNWAASMNPSDYTISPVSGSIAPGQSTTISFYTYSDVPCPSAETLLINGSANTVQIPIVCTYLFISPNTLDSSNCTQNGDWTCVVTISATGDTISVPWQVTASVASGVTFSTASGTLAPDASVQITITIASTTCPGSNSFTISGGSLVNPANYLDWNC